MTDTSLHEACCSKKYSAFLEKILILLQSPYNDKFYIYINKSLKWHPYGYLKNNCYQQHVRNRVM